MPITVAPSSLVAALPASPSPALQPGDVIDALVVAIGPDGSAKISIANNILDVLSQVPLQPGSMLQLAVKESATGLVLALLGQSGGPGTGDAATARGPGPASLQPGAMAEGPVVQGAASSPKTTASVSRGGDVPAPANGLRGAPAVLAQAVGEAAARQDSLAPLFADISQAAQSSVLPTPVAAATGRLQALALPTNAPITAGDVKQAFVRSGLLLEARMAAAATTSPRAGAPVSNDLKATLLVLRQALTGWLATLPQPIRSAPATPPSPVPEAAAQSGAPQPGAAGEVRPIPVTTAADGSGPATVRLDMPKGMPAVSLEAFAAGAAVAVAEAAAAETVLAVTPPADDSAVAAPPDPPAAPTATPLQAAAGEPRAEPVAPQAGASAVQAANKPAAVLSDIAAAPEADQPVSTPSQPPSAVFPRPDAGSNGATDAEVARIDSNVRIDPDIARVLAAMIATAKPEDRAPMAQPALRTAGMPRERAFPLPLPESASPAAEPMPPPKAVATEGEPQANAPQATAVRAAPPPPYPGAPMTGQPPAAATIGPDAGPHRVAERLLAETDAALARQTLLQVASLPDGSVSQRTDPPARWMFEIPFATPQGTTIAQFEIARDRSRGGTAEEARPPAWRARFSLDVEPLGPVHAQISLNHARAAVTLWAERTASAALLREDAPLLVRALAQAELEPGEVLVRNGEPPQPAGPAAGRFLDRAS